MTSSSPAQTRHPPRLNCGHFPGVSYPCHGQPGSRVCLHRLQPEARSALPARPPGGKARTSGEAASSRRRSRGRRACRAGPHLPVSHRSALEFAVGVGPQARQLLLARKGPVPLLAAAVVHGAALAGSDTGTATATHQETAATRDRDRAKTATRTRDARVTSRSRTGIR